MTSISIFNSSKHRDVHFVKKMMVTKPSEQGGDGYALLQVDMLLSSNIR